jgi:hypothetical protein
MSPLLCSLPILLTFFAVSFLLFLFITRAAAATLVMAALLARLKDSVACEGDQTAIHKSTIRPEHLMTYMTRNAPTDRLSSCLRQRHIRDIRPSLCRWV